MRSEGVTSKGDQHWLPTEAVMQVHARSVSSQDPAKGKDLAFKGILFL